MSESRDPVEMRKKRLRVVLLNVIDILLSEYTNDEARFLKQPIALFNCYFLSSEFRHKRSDKQIKALRIPSTKKGNKDLLPAHGTELFWIDIKGNINRDFDPNTKLKDDILTAVRQKKPN